jgi:hypothetical protein
MRWTFKHFEWPDDYYIWLCDLVNLETHSGYSKLVSFLYDTEFVWSVVKDSNRSGDGKMLREDYIHESSWYDISFEEWFDEPCSLLEMLIALARRTRIDLMPEFDIETSDWFWIFIKNLGFDRYDDRCEFDEKFVTLFQKKVSHFGFCDTFLEKRAFLDADIWQKLQAFLAKNYDF